MQQQDGETVGPTERREVALPAVAPPIDSDFCYSYLQCHNNIKWTRDIICIDDLIDAKKNEICDLITLNATAEDLSQLNMSSMNLMQCKRHAACIVSCKNTMPSTLCRWVSPLTLSPFATTSKDWVWLAMQQQHQPLEIAMNEKQRQEITFRCLKALNQVLLEARFMGEAKRYLQWCYKDNIAHQNPTILLARMQWLEGIRDSNDLAHCMASIVDPIIRDIQRHVLPFIIHRPDVMLAHQATLECLWLDRSLSIVAVAKPQEPQKHNIEWFFEKHSFTDNVSVTALREPQHLALKALERYWKSPSFVGTFPKTTMHHTNHIMQQTTLVMDLRDCFRRFLLQSFRDNVEEKTEKEFHLIWENMKQVHGRISPTPALIVLPTGVGKTGVLCLAPLMSSFACRRVLAVCPNVEIRHHLADSFRKFYKMIGISDASPRFKVIDGKFRARWYPDDDVYITNIHRLCGDNLVESFPSDFFNVIIVDEAHHAESTMYRVLREYFVSAAFVFLTATPFRGDHQVIGAREIYRYPVREAIENRYMKNICFVTTSSESQVMSVGVKKLLALRSVSGICHQAILQATNAKQAQDLVELWKQHPDCSGLAIDCVTSKHSKDHNKATLKLLKTGKLDAIVHVDMLTEGFNWNKLSVCLVFRRFSSFAPFVQLVGRVVRWIQEATEADNVAYVIVSKQLDLEQYWILYKESTTINATEDWF